MSVAPAVAPSEVVEPNDSPAREAEEAVVRAAREQIRAHGRDKVTMDDVCSAAGISRATLYRLFPGGRDVLFEAVRVRSISEFLDNIRTEVDGARTLEDFLVRFIVAASVALRRDEHLAESLATATGEALGDLTRDGLDRIIRVATEFMHPYTDEFISSSDTDEIVDITARLVISHFLSPSKIFDFTKRASVARFVNSHLLPAVQAVR